MKTFVVYGFGLAIAQFLLTLILFILGLHSDPAKLAMAQWIATPGAIAIGLAGTAIGVKARRAALPETQAFTYGNAFTAGLGITLFASLLGIALYYMYITAINPQYNELLLQAQLDKLSARGISGDALDRTEKIMRMWMAPWLQCAGGLVASFVFGTIISLVTAAFLKRPGSVPPPLASTV